MSLRHGLDGDWAGIVEVKAELWNEEVRRRQLQAHMPRARPLWRRRTGSWLMAVGGRLMHWGEQMAECESSRPFSVAG